MYYFFLILELFYVLWILLSSNFLYFLWEDSCVTPVGQSILQNALGRSPSVQEPQPQPSSQTPPPQHDDSDADQPLLVIPSEPFVSRPLRPILRVASGGTVCVDVSNIGWSPHEHEPLPCLCLQVTASQAAFIRGHLNLSYSSSVNHSTVCRSQSRTPWQEYQESCLVFGRTSPRTWSFSDWICTHTCCHMLDVQWYLLTAGCDHSRMHRRFPPLGTLEVPTGVWLAFSCGQRQPGPECCERLMQGSIPSQSTWFWMAHEPLTAIHSRNTERNMPFEARARSTTWIAQCNKLVWEMHAGLPLFVCGTPGSLATKVSECDAACNRCFVFVNLLQSSASWNKTMALFNVCVAQLHNFQDHFYPRKR